MASDNFPYISSIDIKSESSFFFPRQNPCLSNPCPADRLCTPDFAWDSFNCDGKTIFNTGLRPTIGLPVLPYKDW